MLKRIGKKYNTVKIGECYECENDIVYGADYYDFNGEYVCLDCIKYYVDSHLKIAECYPEE